jgi:hypothetical protein
MLLRSVILVALLAGCADHEAQQLEHVKRLVCACKDAKCAEAAMKDLPQPDTKTNHHAQGIARDMLDCLAKLYENERPVTDPDAPGSGSASAQVP